MVLQAPSIIFLRSGAAVLKPINRACMMIGMDTIRKAVSSVGGVTALARAINVSPQAIHLWLNGQTQLMARHAAAVEDATGGAVTAYDIGRECAAIADRDRAA
jgi:DNA-binding transcriptional regulator YdaS (Cro superfamily)